jgi:hypothetical protein
MNEMEAEVAKARLETEAALRKHRAMDGEQRMKAVVGSIGSLSAAAAVAAIVFGFVSCGVQDQQNVHDCVASGGQWKQNLTKSYECVRT